jgi:hypothetical protein
MHINGRLSSEEFWIQMDRVYSEVLSQAESGVVYGVAGWPTIGLLGEWALGDGTTRQVEYTSQSANISVTTNPNPAVTLASGSGGSIVVDGVSRSALITEVGRTLQAEVEIDGTVVAVEAVGVNLGELRLERIRDVSPLIEARLDQIAAARGEVRPGRRGDHHAG